MIATPFSPLPRIILHDATLPPGAKTLYAVLKDHARQQSSCYPGYRRLCAILQASEKTVRRWMRTLIEAGYVMQQRRGHMRSNLYTLTPFAHATTAESGILEREFCPPIKIAFEASRKDISSASPVALSVAQEPARAPLPADVAALVLDVARELRDTAPMSSLTRVARMIPASDAPMDMYASVQQARTITRRKLGRIRKRAKGGHALPMPYFLACLARAVGVVSPVRDAVAVEAVPMRVIVPAVAPVRPATPRDDGRAIFWQEVEAACGISDPRAFVAVCHRAAPYPDVQWAVRLVRDARQQRTSDGRLVGRGRSKGQG